MAHSNYVMTHHPENNQMDGNDGDMRKVFLSLNGGNSWTTSTKHAGTKFIKDSHLHYTAEFLLT